MNAANGETGSSPGVGWSVSSPGLSPAAPASSPSEWTASVVENPVPLASVNCPLVPSDSAAEPSAIRESIVPGAARVSEPESVHPTHDTAAV